MFPVEVFEEILKYCDPVDLSRYKSVSTTWNAMIPRIIDKETDIWYKMCLSNVPEKMWCSMFEPSLFSAFDRSNFHDAKNHSPVWIRMWRSWIGWHKLIYMVFTVETFEPLPEHQPHDRITCITLLNNIIAVGSSEGYVTLFDINNTDILGTVDVKQAVVDVHLFGTIDCIGVATSLIDKRSRMCSVTNKIVTFLDTHDDFRWIGRYNYNANLCNGYIVTLAVFDYTFDGLVVKPTFRGALLPTETPRISLPVHIKQANIVAVGAQGDWILIWTGGNTHCIYNFRDEYIPIVDLTVKTPRVPIRRYQIFKPFVVACISELGEFGFSINGNEWKMYNLFKRFCAPVTAILFHVGVLVLGLESGEVHVFEVKDVASLQNLNFDEMKSMKVRLDPKAIISLSVTEHDSARYIVAANTRKVYFIKVVS